MAGSEPERLSSRLVNFAFSLLLVAVALSVTVWLIQSIWPWLVGFAALAGIVVVWLWWRRRW